MAAAPAAEGGEAAGGGLLQFMPLVFMVAIFYFIMIRPQQRREKERKAMIAAVKSGERVLLSSGIIGEVCTVKEKTLIVRIAENTKVEVLKSAVSQIIEKGETPNDVKA
ncbi:preprotein translocase subunit YajC [Tichowtungia aerotolerans]|uniref:Sec translocon accessory complex subunit YajC n=2 Tax=Tichowtungia aerotolerans TaxID=2697043 RepID=A0A6P1MFX1_9BACT|nr:preprotein translocase subunit YajC [Tichowtungia aerotolerans]